MANGSPEKAPNLQNQILGTTIITSHLFETGCKLKISSFSFQVGTSPFLETWMTFYNSSRLVALVESATRRVWTGNHLGTLHKNWLTKKLEARLTKGNCPVEGYNSSDILLFKT